MSIPLTRSWASATGLSRWWWDVVVTGSRLVAARRRRTGDQVVVPDRPSSGTSDAAARRRERAARVEGTAGRRVDRARDLAGERHVPRAGGRVRQRDRVDQGAGVRVAGERRTVAVGPVSTTRPRYMTATSELMCSTTPRSWEMKSTASPSVAPSRRSRLMICACTLTSRALTGSSATISSRLAGERGRDTDALPLPAGQVARVAVGEAGVEPDRSRTARATRARGRWAEPIRWASSDSLHAAADGPARVEAAVRVLEDRLHPAAELRAARRRAGSRRRAVEADLSLVGAVQPEDAAAERGLAAARLPDEPQDLCALDVQVDTSLDRVHAGGGARRDRRAGNRLTSPCTSSSALTTPSPAVRRAQRGPRVPAGHRTGRVVSDERGPGRAGVGAERAAWREAAARRVGADRSGT